MVLKRVILSVVKQVQNRRDKRECLPKKGNISMRLTKTAFEV